MPHNPRIGQEGTPEARIAAAARDLVIRMAQPCPNIPDYADFRDELRPFVRREILAARLEEVMRYGSFPRAIELRNEIEAVNSEIAGRSVPG